MRPWYRFFVEKPESERELEGILKRNFFGMIAAAIVFGFSLVAMLASQDVSSVMKYGFVSLAVLLLGVFCYVDGLLYSIELRLRARK